MIYAISQQKGGTGKTTTALALASGLSRRGQKTLVIDLDAQCNLSYTIGATSASGATSADILAGASSAAAAIIHGGGIDVIPAAPALGVTPMRGDRWQWRLADALAEIATNYNAVVIDTPPTLGQVLAVALCAADLVIVPTSADYYSLQGVNQICQTVESARAINRKIKIAGVLLTKYNARKVISRDTAALIEATAAKYKTRLFKTKIRQCVAVEEAAALRQNIFEYAPASSAAKDYFQFTEELLNYGKKDF